MDLDILARQLATGLTRVAVAVQAAGGATDVPRTLVEQQVLLMLARRRPEYPIRRLAAELGLTMPTTISTVAMLQREGLVSMDPMPSYSPAEVMVALTARGAEQAPRIRHWAPDLLAAIDELDPDERIRLLGVVIRHIQLMQRRGQIHSHVPHVSVLRWLRPPGQRRPAPLPAGGRPIRSPRAAPALPGSGSRGRACIEHPQKGSAGR